MPTSPTSTVIDAVKLLAVALLCVCSSVFAGDFSFQDMRGNTLSLSGYKGKWVLVNFWATWCPPCQAEIPELNALAASHKDLVVIGIAMDYANAKVVDDFAKKHRIAYPIVLGKRSIAQQVGDFDVLPTSYLYSPDGEQVAVQRGALTRDGVEGFIRGRQPR